MEFWDNDEGTEVKKPNKRRANRIAAMQFTYVREVQKDVPLREAMGVFFDDLGETREYYEFGWDLAMGIQNHLAEVDEEIKGYTENWAFHRIGKVDLAILRLAIYELLFRKDIPPIVSINEAIDLAKEYSEEDSRRFINGILDKVKAKLNRPLRTAYVEPEEKKEKEQSE